MRTCTKEDPWNPEYGTKGGVEHPDAKEISEDYGRGGGAADGDYIQYECPNCGHKWKEELPN